MARRQRELSPDVFFAVNDVDALREVAGGSGVLSDELSTDGIDVQWLTEISGYVGDACCFTRNGWTYPALLHVGVDEKGIGDPHTASPIDGEGHHVVV